MTDLIFLGFVFLTITVSVSTYYLGKIKGNKEGFQRGWVDGMDDRNSLEVSLRRQINDLEETIKRFTVEQIPVKKKVGRPKLK